MTPVFLPVLPLLIPGKTADSSQPEKKDLLVRRLYFPVQAPSLDEVSAEMDRETVSFHPIACGWAEFPYHPDVKFRMARGRDELYVQYRVRESYLLAQCDLDDDACWPANDSCVEFFVSPGSDDQYMNFEFSCIGYCLIESGMKGSNRLRLPRETTDRVRRCSSLGSATFEMREGDFSWTLTAAIPLFIITGQESPELSGKTWKANFYKCGDKLKEKAYLAWSPVNVPAPSFHQPGEFGLILFE